MTLVTFTLLINHCHSVEVVLGEVEVLTRLILHVLACVVVNRQLFDFETVFVIYFVGHAAWMRH